MKLSNYPKICVPWQSFTSFFANVRLEGLETDGIEFKKIGMLERYDFERCATLHSIPFNKFYSNLYITVCSF